MYTIQCTNYFAYGSARKSNTSVMLNSNMDYIVAKNLILESKAKKESGPSSAMEMGEGRKRQRGGA